MPKNSYLTCFVENPVVVVSYILPGILFLFAFISMMDTDSVYFFVFAYPVVLIISMIIPGVTLLDCDDDIKKRLLQGALAIHLVALAFYIYLINQVQGH